jgi:hypothetical protein
MHGATINIIEVCLDVWEVILVYEVRYESNVSSFVLRNRKYSYTEINVYHEYIY